MDEEILMSTHLYSNRSRKLFKTIVGSKLKTWDVKIQRI